MANSRAILREQAAFLRGMNNQAYRSGIARQVVSKPVNLPSWRKVGVDIDHICSGHLRGGWRIPGSNKTLFPENMSREQVEKAIRQAYRYGKKMQTQRHKVAVEGYYKGTKIEMWLNTKTKEIESAWPTK